MQPLKSEGLPLDLASKSEPINETLEPVSLAESHKRHVGGISVEESRDLMREADLIDRKVERQRIKSKHKEQRRKIKKRRREEQVMNNNNNAFFFIVVRKIIVAYSLLLALARGLLAIDAFCA